MDARIYWSIFVHYALHFIYSRNVYERREMSTTDGEKHSEPAVLVWISGRIHVCAKCMCVCVSVSVCVAAGDRIQRAQLRVLGDLPIGVGRMWGIDFENICVSVLQKRARIFCSM